MMSSLLTAEGLSGLLFLCFVVITLAGAVIATSARSLTRSVAGLALSFLGVAGLYYYLGSPFVALLQILIYVGAVCVIIIFAIMLANDSELKRQARRNGFAVILAALSCAALVWTFVSLAIKSDWLKPSGSVSDGSVEKIGQALLTTYNMSFELISLVLLVAIVGSLVLARAGRSKS